MNSTSGDLISLALQRSFSPKYKKAQKNSLDEHIVANARRVLSTKIDYVLTAKYSTSGFLEGLKNKYIVLKPSKSNKKNRKKKKKLKNQSYEDSVTSKLQMKNTELSGQNLSLPSPKIVLFSPDAVQLGWKNTLPVGSGFVNTGTTCYINSTLQALFHVPCFVNWLLDDRKHHTACEKMNGVLHTECIVCAMSKTLHQSHRLTGSSVKPRLVIEKVKTICKHLSPFRQEDAHEFLRYLMEAMEKSYTAILGIQVKKLDNYSKETTPLNQIFGGYIRTEVTCLECSQVSTTFQHFQDLILDIRQASTSTVYDGLENYFSKERLDGDESYHCEHCKKKVSAYKKFSIEKAPNALCIQLKRFNINNFYGGSKISKMISIPRNIDLSKFKHEKGSPNGTPLKYRLVSMVFHHGLSANSGHYTALGCTSSGSYYYFNDEQVYPTHLGQYTNNPNAYIMFYELEKSLIHECAPTVRPSSSTSTITSMPNGCANGTIQRNGFFTKRETSCSTSSNHSKQPSWELNKYENQYNSTKPVSTVTSNSASKTSTSLVPYMSSDSDDSDLENDKKMDKNNNSQIDDNERKTLSPLAKRNSTLTSLLTSSPKNENSNRVTSPTKTVTSNGKPLRLDTFNKENEDELKGTLLELKPEKRGAITFSFFNRDKKKIDGKNENGDGCSEDAKSKNGKQAVVGIATPYYNSNNDCHKTNGEKERNDEKNQHNETNGNGLTNGMSKTNMVNGNGKVASNGWIIAEIEDEHNVTVNGNAEKVHASSVVKGEWIVIEKGAKKCSSPSKEHKQNDNQENGRKHHNGIEETKDENNVTNDSQNGYGSSSYSSYNGYGGKVITWNGDISYINKETEKERKESSKRTYSQLYDDDMDRGRVKKPKYHNRNENGSNAGQRKNNLFQQHYNNYNRSKRPSWAQNGHHYGNNRKYQNNYQYNKPYGNYRPQNNGVHNNWKR